MAPFSSHHGFTLDPVAVPPRLDRDPFRAGEQEALLVGFDLIMTEIELGLRELSGYDGSEFAANSAAYLASQGVDASLLSDVK